MTRYTTDAELVVTKPTESERYSFIVPSDDILSFELSSKAGRRVDSGSLVIDNEGYQYTTGGMQLDSDDRLELWVSDEDTDTMSGDGFSTGPFGAGPFGGLPDDRVATAIATNPTISSPRQSSTLAIDIEDFVFNRLNERNAFYSEVGRQIVTGDDNSPGHLDAILKQYAPEVDRSQLVSINATIDYAADGIEVAKAVGELASHARAQTGEPVIATSRGTSLVFTPLPDRTNTAITATLDGSSLGDPSTSLTPPRANEIRVEGGIDDENKIDDSQTTQSAYVTITDTNRQQVRVRARKRELTRFEVWTRKLEGSSDTLRVRIQADDGGAPIAPADTDSDIASGTAESPPDTTGGYQEVRLGEYTLAPQGNPWVIFEADGSDGIELGTDGSTPTYIAHFPKPVIVEIPDQPSQSTYRQHDAVIEDESLVTFPAAEQLARRELERQADQRVELTGEALTDTVHGLRVGDLVEVDQPGLRAVGPHIVTERTATFDGPTLREEYRLEGYDTYA